MSDSGYINNREWFFVPNLPFTCDHMPKMLDLSNPSAPTECLLCGATIRYNNLIEPGPNRWELYQ